MQYKKVMVFMFLSATLIGCIYVSQQKKFGVGITSFEFYDEQQDRTIITEVWYPIDSDQPMESIDIGYFKQINAQRDAPISSHKKQYPLILFSHGYGGDRWGNSWIAEYLAQCGFIVTAMDHYGNTWYNMTLKWSIKPFIRAKDISFVLTQLLHDPYWCEKIDTNAIGALGFSQGGAAALLLAGAQLHVTDIAKDLGQTLSPEFKQQLSEFLIDYPFDYEAAHTSFFDPRIKRAVAMAPGFGGENSVFTEQSLQNVQVPVLILAGEADDINPIASNAQFYAAHINQAQLYMLPGNVSHWVFMNEGSPLGKQEAPHLTIDTPDIDRGKYHKIIGKIVLDFFKKM